MHINQFFSKDYLSHRIPHAQRETGAYHWNLISTKTPYIYDKLTQWVELYDPNQC